MQSGKRMRRKRVNAWRQRPRELERDGNGFAIEVRDLKVLYTKPVEWRITAQIQYLD